MEIFTYLKVSSTDDFERARAFQEEFRWVLPQESPVCQLVRGTSCWPQFCRPAIFEPKIVPRFTFHFPSSLGWGLGRGSGVGASLVEGQKSLKPDLVANTTNAPCLLSENWQIAKIWLQKENCWAVEAFPWQWSSTHPFLQTGYSCCHFVVTFWQKFLADFFFDLLPLCYDSTFKTLVFWSS